MSKSKSEQEKAEAREHLLGLLKPGDTVRTVLRHVSRSGMSRRIDLYLAKGDELLYLSGWAAQAMGDRVSRAGGIIVGGCGMDMGFHLVYNLGWALWPEGFRCAGKRCRSNDHSNSPESKNRKHRDGGYALRQEWI